MQSKANRVRQLLQVGELSPQEIAAVVGTTAANVRQIRQRMKRPEALSRLASDIESLRLEMRVLQRQVGLIETRLSDISGKVNKTAIRRVTHPKSAPVAPVHSDVFRW